ncbi:MAG: DNA-binding protein [Thermoprotei archaeon]|nr:MAG: DNA-binding protein [Thermoprotei archaeon]
MHEKRMYLASIKPKYAYRIFAGIKKFELRRWFGLKPVQGSVIIVYASGNVKAIIGEFRVGRVLFAKPNEIWDALSEMKEAGIGSDDYQYIRGSKYALAIEVVDPVLYTKPITLKELKSIIPGFMPPLSFRELRPYEPLYELIVRKAREQVLRAVRENFI